MEKLGLTISDGFKISLGDNIDSLRKFIREFKIKYHAPVDLCNDSIESTEVDNVVVLVMLKESGVEVKVEKGIITYIKAYNSGLNEVTYLNSEEVDAIEAIKIVTDKISEKVGIDKQHLRLKTFDSDKLFFTFETKFKSERNAIISIVNTANKILYIETIQYV